MFERLRARRRESQVRRTQDPLPTTVAQIRTSQNLDHAYYNGRERQPHNWNRTSKGKLNSYEFELQCIYQKYKVLEGLVTNPVVAEGQRAWANKKLAKYNVRINQLGQLRNKLLDQRAAQRLST